MGGKLYVVLLYMYMCSISVQISNSSSINILHIVHSMCMYVCMHRIPMVSKDFFF